MTLYCKIAELEVALLSYHQQYYEDEKYEHLQKLIKFLIANYHIYFAKTARTQSLDDITTDFQDKNLEILTKLFGDADQNWLYIISRKLNIQLQQRNEQQIQNNCLIIRNSQEKINIDIEASQQAEQKHQFNQNDAVNIFTLKKQIQENIMTI